MIRSQRGALLVELMVAIAVLGIFMGMFATMQVEYFKKFNEVSTDTVGQSSIRSIEEDILRDERYIFPQSSNPALDAATLGEKALADSFAAALTHSRCYTSDGVLRKSTSDPCFYNVTFYRVAVHDRRIPASSAYAKVPVSRLAIRITYPRTNEQIRKDPGGGSTKTIYITKLITSVFPY